MLIDLIKANRSYRGYDSSRMVTRKEMLEMVNCARLSASSINKQPLKYFITNDKKTVKAINSQIKMGGLLPDLHLPLEGEEPPAFIVICQDLKISSSMTGFLKDVGIAAQSILLSAAEMGLGGCMVGNFIPERLEHSLKLGEDFRPYLVIAVGKPVEEIKLIEIEEGQSTKYYRDETGIHYVPKKKLEDIIL